LYYGLCQIKKLGTTSRKLGTTNNKTSLSINLKRIEYNR
jgi:hypothetical protein